MINTPEQKPSPIAIPAQRLLELMIQAFAGVYGSES